jgi:triosephosphate isomerase
MRPLIAGNWKMHGTAAQLSDIAGVAAVVRATHPAADILICPPATLIARAVEAAAGQISIGGQNCASEISGAFTGDLSAEMLKDAGATWVILGHSERRQHHGETNSIVAAKAHAARRAGLLAIICIGETGAQRRAGDALTVCAESGRCRPMLRNGGSVAIRWGGAAQRESTVPKLPRRLQPNPKRRLT